MAGMAYRATTTAMVTTIGLTHPKVGGSGGSAAAPSPLRISVKGYTPVFGLSTTNQKFTTNGETEGSKKRRKTRNKWQTFQANRMRRNTQPQTGYFPGSVQDAFLSHLKCIGFLRILSFR